MAKQKQDGEIRGSGFFQMYPERENKEAATYWERILPTLISTEEYFDKIEPKEEWYRRHEEKALSNYYGMDISVTLKNT